MATDVPELPVGTTITLIRGDEWWVATDEETGVASQGETREEALENLDEAVALHNSEAGRPVTDDDLREWGIDPDELPEEPSPLPDFVE